ncbi:glycerol-3-phosphate acyltransferase mino isoform X2 [Oratosquilla oratoria]|uniref:glycerol-3-phosphate acyltransferase mino isoform X2 n=1 Tax=Oratosquilla oratoria TaxID=337810 RepID=UPI003F76F0A7
MTAVKVAAGEDWTNSWSPVEYSSKMYSSYLPTPTTPSTPMPLLAFTQPASCTHYCSPSRSSEVDGGGSGGGGGLRGGQDYKQQQEDLVNSVASIMPTPPASPPLTGYGPRAFCSNGLVEGSTSQLGVHSLLRVPTSNTDWRYLTRQCCYVFHCLSLKVSFSYPTIPNQLIIKDERVASAIDQAVTDELEDRGLDEGADGKLYSSLIAKQTARAHRLLNDMKAAISTTLIRLTGYVLFKVFNRLLMSVTIHGGQLEMIDRAAQKDRPLIFLPLHRSHVDYLFVTWILFNRQIPAPIVAAGENLKIPVFGWLLRGLGGFFIKRRLESNKSRKDVVYRSVLQTYMSHALQSGFNLEFFIEGGRTRTGKPCMPKGGLLSVLVDAYVSGTLDDALIVPIAINYDKLLDGNFIREQLGQNKVPESFWGAVRAIIKVLSTNYGHSRIDFGQPFSLREYIQGAKLQSLRSVAKLSSTTPPLSPYPSAMSLTPSSTSPQSSLTALTPVTDAPAKCHHRSLSSPNTNNHLLLKQTLSNPGNSVSDASTIINKQNLHGARSNSSLFGSEVTDEYRNLVKSLAAHIVYDSEKCQAIMSTNALSWLLLNLFREGASLATLTKALDTLRETLTARGRDTGFSGESREVVKHAAKLLGAGLIRTEVSDSRTNDDELTFIKPITLLPNVIELCYYSNALAPVFALDAIVATALVSLVDCDLWSYSDCPIDTVVSREDLVARSLSLAHILENEFILAPPCASLKMRIHDVVDRFAIMGLIADIGVQNKQWTDDSDSDGVGGESVQVFKVTPTSQTLEVVGAWTQMLTPLLDSYFCTASGLCRLVNRQMPDKEFVHDTQTDIQARLEQGSLKYGESIAVDPIRNALKFLENKGIIESYSHDNVRLIYLSRAFDAEEQLTAIINDIDLFRC